MVGVVTCSTNEKLYELVQVLSHFHEYFNISMDEVNHRIKSLQRHSHSPDVVTPQNQITEQPQRYILKFDLPGFHGVNPHGWIFEIS